MVEYKIIEVESSDIQKTFNELVMDSVKKYGGRPNNGMISTTALGKEVKVRKGGKLSTDESINEAMMKVDEVAKKYYTIPINTGVIEYKPIIIKPVDEGKMDEVVSGSKFTLEYSSNGKDFKEQFNDILEAKSRMKKLISTIKYIGMENPIITAKSKWGGRVTVYTSRIVEDGERVTSPRKSRRKKFVPIYRYILVVGYSS